MASQKIKLPAEPIAEHKNAIPTNYKNHLDKQQPEVPEDKLPLKEEDGNDKPVASIAAQ